MKRSTSRNVGKKAGERGAPDLADLVVRFRSGDEFAFEEIVRRLSPRIYLLALRSLGDGEAAEEMVQDTWVRVYRRIGDLKSPEAFEGWAMRVALSRINDEFRSRARERAARRTLSERTPEASEEEGLSSVEREELGRLIRNALSRLDEPHREVFMLREMEGLAHSKIAEVLDIPEGTVWSRLSYARRALREHLLRRKDEL